jgi:MoaA/NifB/PqqE/SkfB family radical SAM enzyme
MKLEKQEILVGSSRLSKVDKNSFDRVKYFIKNMEYNKSYKYKLEGRPHEKEKILQELRDKYQNYRKNWTEISSHYEKKDNFEKYLENIHDPLSVDIETASVCDLACPHCSREYIITPDKIMDFELYKKIIKEISKKNVPSIKLNWRGEPLLNPKIHELIDYAKQNGILEVCINTNAVSLDKKRSKQLIEAGLDVIIFSFDGGSKETYEKLRPARFKKNKFESVYSNIKTFYETKKEMNSKFPVTKIQMILTKDSRDEVDNFFNLFNGIVDDVTVTQYNERGGNISDLTKNQKNKLEEYLNKNNLPHKTPYLIDFEGNLFISKKRKPCEQLFQRLMITYDGRVGMCCHDWGAQHGIGFIDEKAFDNSKIVSDLEKKIKERKKGFELLNNAVKPKSFNEPVKKVQTLEQIWGGEELNKVRKDHYNRKVNSVDVCKECTFKDTYSWEKIH